MLTPRLNNCVDCTTIPSLLSDIDCKMTELAKNQYNNTIYALNLPILGSVMSDLLNYKRILTYKYCNPEYAVDYTVAQIASKIKILINK
jgi:hypothetical protein